MRTLKLAIRRLRINKKKLQFEKVSFPCLEAQSFFKRTAAASAQTKHEKTGTHLIAKESCKKVNLLARFLPVSALRTVFFFGIFFFFFFWQIYA